MSEQQFEFGQMVLIRYINLPRGGLWRSFQFSHIEGELLCTIGGVTYMRKDVEIIPYEGNEHLLGTTNEPEPKFQPKKGQLVAVSDEPDCEWEIHKYADYYDNRYWCVAPYEDVNDEDNHVSWLYCEPLKNHFDIGD